MRIALLMAGVAAGVTLLAGGASAAELPTLRRNGEAIQLMVDGAPYLALGGELHNSSPSSPAYMAPVWDKLARNDVRTVIGAASWELVEPQEGRYDFTAVDDQIEQARKRGIRLVMIWFGAYKNAESTYAPSWVRRDERRFPRATRDPAKTLAGRFPLNGPILSVFNDRLAEADARAFAALMQHIKQVDKAGTVIMVQVENEVGLLGDSRDRSALANAAWARPVPRELIAYLRAHRASLNPWLLDLWKRQGFREQGTWAEVFGEDRAAEEVFMAWGFGRYVDRVARAGAAEHALPAYANAWLGPKPGAEQPGQYPSGGPVPRMLDVWKAAAPSLALLAPDIYIDDFTGVLTDYKRADNPIFIPEAKIDAGNLFVALGQFDAIGFNPFGIEDGADGHDLFKAYAVLGERTGQPPAAQAEGRIRGFKITARQVNRETLGGYTVSISGPFDTRGLFGAGTGTAAAPPEAGYGLIIHSGPDEFTVVARGVTLNFAAANAKVETDAVQEGAFKDGQWVPGRTLNGDERYFLFPNDSLRTVRIRLLRRAGT
jgi:hypothetical protein